MCQVCVCVCARVCERHSVDCGRGRWISEWRPGVLPTRETTTHCRWAKPPSIHARLFTAGRQYAPVRRLCQTLSSVTLYANVCCDAVALSISGCSFISRTFFQTATVVRGCSVSERGSIDAFLLRCCQSFGVVKFTTHVAFGASGRRSRATTPPSWASEWTRPAWSVFQRVCEGFCCGWRCREAHRGAAGGE